MTHFDECLTMGQSFETQAYYWLIKAFPDFWVTNCSNFNMQNIYQGPSGRKDGEDRLILPDFMLMNNETTFWVDAKSKTKSFRLTPNPEEYLTIDPVKHQEYLRVQTELDTKVFILFGEQLNKRLFMFPVDDWSQMITFNNRFDHYGKDGPTPCYQLEQASMKAEITW